MLTYVISASEHSISNWWIRSNGKKSRLCRNISHTRIVSMLGLYSIFLLLCASFQIILMILTAIILRLFITSRWHPFTLFWCNRPLHCSTTESKFMCAEQSACQRWGQGQDVGVQEELKLLSNTRTLVQRHHVMGTSFDQKSPAHYFQLATHCLHLIVHVHPVSDNMQHKSQNCAVNLLELPSHWRSWNLEDNELAALHST